MFYTEAYMRGKVSLVFYKSMMAEKDLFKHTIGSETRIQDQLQPWANLVPVDLSELRDTLKILEADTFDELKIKLKRRKRPLEAFVRK